MSDQKKLAAVRDLIESAQKSISAARKIIATLAGEGQSIPDLDTEWLSNYKSGPDKIVEGVFTGDSMLGSDGNIYPIPQNYASKSHLVQGSKVKAIIGSDGKITYKIIEEIEYTSQIGLVTMNHDKYQVVSEGKTYNVLTASVTFLKAQIGDTVSLRLPKGKEATFATLDAVIPKEISRAE
jgi:hypothetical protein